MSVFSILKIPGTSSWVISDPKRGTRPHDEKKKDCPFCHKSVQERIITTSESGDVMVLNNKFPFADHHEVIVHTRSHTDQLFTLLQDAFFEIIQMWRQRFETYKDKGIVCIFSNSGAGAGESVAHTHSQLAVLDERIELDMPHLESEFEQSEKYEVGAFELVCPPYSEWPDETWIVPKNRGKYFYEIRGEEIKSFGFILKRILFLLSLRHGDDFPYNFVIYPFRDWYMRIIPRAKVIGGLEVGTGVMVNTGEARETIDFLREHFYEEDEKLIRAKKALYRRTI